MLQAHLGMGLPPFQCYNCSGWGHRAFECPSPLNYQRGEDPRKRREQNLPWGKTTVQNRTNQNKTQKQTRTKNHS